MAMAARFSRRHLRAVESCVQLAPAISSRCSLHIDSPRLLPADSVSDGSPGANRDQNPVAKAAAPPPKQSQPTSAASLPQTKASDPRQVEGSRPWPALKRPSRNKRTQQSGASQPPTNRERQPRQDLQPRSQRPQQQQRPDLASSQPEVSERQLDTAWLNNFQHGSPSRQPGNKEFQRNQSQAGSTNRFAGRSEDRSLSQRDSQRPGAPTDIAQQPRPQAAFGHSSSQQERLRSGQDSNRFPRDYDRDTSMQGQRPPRQSWQQAPTQQARGPSTQGSGFQLRGQDASDLDDPNQSGKEARRRLKPQTGRKSSPSPTRAERGAPGVSMRAGGSAKGAQLQNRLAYGMPVTLDSEDAHLVDQTEEDSEGRVPENMLARLQHNAQGVPASWKNEIQDAEDQEDLDDARQISAFMRRHRSGEVRFLEEELKENLHSLQMNSDPRLEFGMNTPKVQEMAAPDMKEVLQAAREPMRRITGVESDEDWQEMTEGLAEEFAVVSEQMGHGASKPRAQEASLKEYVTQSMPSSHPMFSVVSQSLQMLQHNPNWNDQKKSQYMKRLIKDLS